MSEKAKSISESVPEGNERRSGTVFYRVAAVLIAVQIATAILAAGFTVWYARDAQRSLATVAIAARLDAVAEEIERRSSSLNSDLSGFSDELKLDLKYRFPDPLAIVGLDGSVSEAILPAPDAFGVAFSEPEPESERVMIVPEFVGSDEALIEVVADYSDDSVVGGFATAPLFDETGFPVGVVLVQPLSNSMTLELADTRSAFLRSIRIVAFSSVILALLLGAFFTWWLVRPLRLMAANVQRIGRGSYEERLEVSGKTEMASLASAINVMSERVQNSIDELKAADRERRELIANIGHDLRTPLSAIRAHLEESSRFREAARYDEAGASIKAAERQTVFLNALIDDLFELGVLESGYPRLRKEPVLIAELVSDAVAGNIAAARESQVTLFSNINPRIPVFEADGTRLLRLLNNLISNGIRHTPEGGEVVVSATTEENRLELEVSDTGEGISEADMARLFDRYYRGDDSRTRASSESMAKGTGLGLAIARAIAEAHAGSLSVSSTEGVGTVMTLVLPLGALSSPVLNPSMA